jgi:hypothetical protein
MLIFKSNTHWEDSPSTSPKTREVTGWPSGLRCKANSSQGLYYLPVSFHRVNTTDEVDDPSLLSRKAGWSISQPFYKADCPLTFVN